MLAVAPLASAQSDQQGDQQGDNPFGQIESQTLPNGLKVWTRPVPDQSTVDVTLIVAGGASVDPVGKEQLAHFAEHVVFADRPGLSEAELNRQIESRGGKIVARTSWDGSVFRVTLPAEHAAIAIRWMAQLVTPRPISAAMVERQRPPLLLEVGATPRGAAGWIRALLLDPPWLRRASVWERDFGLSTIDDRPYYPHRSLHAITAADLQAFLERWYVPANMTLLVTGGGITSATAALVDSAFGALPARPEPALPRSTRRSRARDVTFWTPRRQASYTLLLRGVSLGAHDRVLTLFLREFLEKRLNDRLRYGDAKLVYHPSATLNMLGDAALMVVTAASDRADVGRVRTIVEDEVARLRRGEADSAFVADRDAIASRFRLAARDVGVVIDAATSHFFATGRGGELPDMVTIYERATPAMLASLLHRRFPPEGTSVRLLLPSPLSPVMVALLAAIIVVATVALARRRLVVPVDMRRVRYVARIRSDLLLAVPLLAVTGAFCVVLGRLLVAGARPFLEAVVFPLPSLPLQAGVYVLGLALATTAVVWLGSRIPRKILVFEDHARLKYLSYRSVILRPVDIAECRRASFSDVWVSRRLWRCLALTFGVGTRGVYLRRRDGRAWFFRTRQPDEVVHALASIGATESGRGAQPLSSGNPEPMAEAETPAVSSGT